MLREPDIQALALAVRETLRTIGEFHCLRTAAGMPYAFAGVADSKIEMLFVHPAYKGCGVGRSLVDHAVRSLGATQVDVNEQNEQAAGFHEHVGFRRIGRFAPDPFGNPFPILHMALPS